MYYPTRPMSTADIAHDLFEKLSEEALLAYIETVAPPLTPWEQTDTITFGDDSHVSRHLPDRLNPERTPNYHFIGSPYLPEQKERKEPANPSTQQPPMIDNTHLGNLLDTESVIIEILDGAESIARNDLQIPMPYELYTNQNHQRSFAIFMATVPQAHHMINNMLLLAAIPPEIRNDDELVTAMITKRCIEELDETDWLALVEAMKKVISQEPDRRCR